MHPFIVRDTPTEKCPICHMELARRKKGSTNSKPLPAGIVNRVQLSPYRIVLAGVETSAVNYMPLTKQIVTFGTVEFNETKQRHIAARQKGRIVKLFVNYTGQVVDKGEELAVLDVRYSSELNVTLEDLLRARKNGNKEQEEMSRKRLELWDIGEEQVQEFLRTGKVGTQLTIRSPIKGHVIRKYQKEGNYVDEGTPLYDIDDLDTVWVEAQVYEADQGLLRDGQAVSATTLSLPNEEFKGKLTFLFPHLDESTRTLMARFELPNPHHKLKPGMYATVRISVAPGDLGLGSKTGAGSKSGTVLSTETGAKLKEGLVLAVPENAVIDTGTLKVVYRQASPGTFEGVSVQLGPRMSQGARGPTFYAVIDGLKAGDKVATNGSFLIDAETRLNPAAGSIYYGAGNDRAPTPNVPVRPSTPVEPGEAERKGQPKDVSKQQP